MLRTIKKINKLLRDPVRSQRFMFAVIKTCFIASAAAFAYLLILAQSADTYGYFSLREMMSSTAEHCAAALMLTVGGALIFDVTTKKRGE